jgi:hypothetical protein
MVSAYIPERRIHEQHGVCPCVCEYREAALQLHSAYQNCFSLTQELQVTSRDVTCLPVSLQRRPTRPVGALFIEIRQLVR